MSRDVVDDDRGVSRNVRGVVLFGARAQTRRRGNFKSSWREGAGDNAKKFEGGARAQAMMPGNIKWREGAGNDAEELGAQPLSADCVAARRCC